MTAANNYAHQLIFSDRRSYRWIRHLLFWLLYSVFFSALGINEWGVFTHDFRLTILWSPLTLLNVYITLYWLVPKYLMQSDWRSFTLVYGSWVIVEIALAFLTHYYLAYTYIWSPGQRPAFRQALPEILDIYPLVVLNGVTLFAVFIRMFKFWRVEELQKVQMRQQKTDAELQLLQAQLHPHFLFNTLNNLYSLVLEKSSKAPEMLSRLSAILSYVLNDCQKAEVQLKKEVTFCRDYIKLESERYGDRLDLSLEFPEDIGHWLIAPMLFQPFIENAFKHGAAEQVGKVWMSIALSVRGDQVWFRVINSADPSIQQRSLGGIGIANIQRRLELLYPDRYKLVREQQEGKHLISLTINLPSVKPRHKGGSQSGPGGRPAYLHSIS